VAQLPFHYYLALRGDWIKSNTVQAEVDVDASEVTSPVDDVVGTYNAKSLTGEMV
jgi:hypothetical protein